MFEYLFLQMEFIFYCFYYPAMIYSQFQNMYLFSQSVLYFLPMTFELFLGGTLNIFTLQPSIHFYVDMKKHAFHLEYNKNFSFKCI